jgi:hypothetical protein
MTGENEGGDLFDEIEQEFYYKGKPEKGPVEVETPETEVEMPSGDVVPKAEYDSVVAQLSEKQGKVEDLEDELGYYRRAVHNYDSACEGYSSRILKPIMEKVGQIEANKEVEETSE